MSVLAKASKIPGLARLVAVMDGLYNPVTGAGTSRSKGSHSTYVADLRLTDEVIENLFRDNDIARKIITKIVNAALGPGFTIRRADQTALDDMDAGAAILKKWRDLGGDEKFKRAACWARAFGGGGLIAAAVGSGSMSSPLDPESVEDVVLLEDWDKQALSPATYYPTGSVETWYYSPPAGPGPDMRERIAIHESRLFRFTGPMTTNTERQRNQGWDNSCLQAPYNVIRSFDNMWGSIEDMWADASQRVFKLQGFAEGIMESTGDGEKDVFTRLQFTDLMSSMRRAIFLDAGTKEEPAESFEVVERTAFGTLSDMTDRQANRLAAAADMPLTVLFGVSPNGMDATGESDLILWFNTVDEYRRTVLTPVLTKIIRLLAHVEKDSDPDSWVIEWPELQRPKPLDVSTAENMRVRTAVELVNVGAVEPEELSLSLSRMAPNLNLWVDTESRRKALKDALKLVAEGEPDSDQLGEQPEGEVPPERMSERRTPSRAAKQQV
jgi:phage-related protein (TIGR01555 family)